jgi:AcrR family transcriptional regulator
MTDQSVIYLGRISMPRVSAERRKEYLQERREQILDAAIEALGKKGFEGTNVADIAKAAGIAKGTVYLYFESKEEIFSAILSERSLLPWFTDRVMSKDVPLETMLTDIARHFLQSMPDYLPIIHLVLSDGQRSPAHAEQLYQDVILKGNKLLAAYLAAQAKAGRIRPLDNPFLTARAFMGMLMTYVLTQEMLGGKHFTSIKLEAWVREVVQLFLDGIRPRRGES